MPYWPPPLLWAIPRTASTGNITSWYEWRPAGWDSLPGALRGWQRVHGQYQGVTIQIDAMTQVGEEVQCEGWCCDIRQVQELSASKSPLDDFADLDGFAEARR